MEKLATQFFLFTLFFAFLLHALPTTSKQVGDEIEFNYDQNGEKGPARWGELKEEWSNCSKGSKQSPIDLLNQRVELISPNRGRINRNYKPSNATLKNEGHDITLEWENDEVGTIIINGNEYFLRECHWHAPSEHTINGMRFALEMHMVHKTLDGNRIAVVGILYTIGRPDPFLSSLTGPIRSVAGTEGKEAKVGIVNPMDINAGNLMYYYRYEGSLTTPPCSENVLWTILREVRTVTREQVTLLQEAVHKDSLSNARPIQQTNGRSVHLYESSEENFDEHDDDDNHDDIDD